MLPEPLIKENIVFKYNSEVSFDEIKGFLEAEVKKVTN